MIVYNVFQVSSERRTADIDVVCLRLMQARLAGPGVLKAGFRLGEILFFLLSLPRRSSITLQL
jgi:hypothetical protein